MTLLETNKLIEEFFLYHLFIFTKMKRILLPLNAHTAFEEK